MLVLEKNNENDLPNTWEFSLLFDISLKITDGEHLKPKFIEKGIPFVSAKDIMENGVSFNDVKFVSKDDAKKFRTKCNPERNDILIVSRGNVGRTCIVKVDNRFCLLGSVILLKIKKLIDSNYVNYFLKNSKVQNKLIRLSGSTVQGAIYIRDIKKLIIPIAPLNEQKRIVSKIEELFSHIDNSEETLKQTLGLFGARIGKGKSKEFNDSVNQFKALKTSILKKAFEGKLVPQDPNDEPASELLDKIKK